MSFFRENWPGVFAAVLAVPLFLASSFTAGLVVTVEVTHHIYNVYRSI